MKKLKLYLKMIYRLLLVALFSISLVSCEEDTNTTADLTQKENTIQLNLVKMSGQVRNSETTGDAMPWQESYELGSKMSFTKTRIEEGKTMTSTGTFEIATINGDKYLKFIHDMDGVLVGNCTGDNIELLKYADSSSLIGTWSACDGPGLFYEFE